MPTFYLYGNLIHFAAFKNHIGLYPTPSGIEAFQQELSQYEGSKGAIKFPHDKPLPLDLISKITKYRIEENLKKAEIKAGKKKTGKQDRAWISFKGSRNPYRSTDALLRAETHSASSGACAQWETRSVFSRAYGVPSYSYAFAPAGTR
jgi:hypothetical protein